MRKDGIAELVIELLCDLSASGNGAWKGDLLTADASKV